MQHPLLRKDVQDFIRDNETIALHSLILKGSPFSQVSIQEIAQQIEGRSRTKLKLPRWFETKGILYPPKLNLEQASSELTALYKSSLIKGRSVVDLTGGFGIDSYYFAQKSDRVTYIEINDNISDLAKHNFEILSTENIQVIKGDSIEFLKTKTQTYDSIYIDPARRSHQKTRVFQLEDCTPNVVKHMDLLLTSCENLWIKTAPMLDISAGLKELKNVIAIHIIAVKNEVKELLWHVRRIPSNEEVSIITVNLNTVQQRQEFSLEEMHSAQASYDAPQSYLYEPNAALLKSGAFKWISSHFSLSKLHEHTHLYTSSTRIEFPGRRFKIEAVIPYSKRLIKELSISKAHITTRNFRISVKDLRKQLHIKDGGDIYLFFTTKIDDKSIVLVCSKF